METLTIGKISITIERKKIKNMYLKVRPPMGKVIISAPQKLQTDAIEMFAIDKLPWIKKQQQKIQSQVRESPRQYIENESHYLWGELYLLKIVDCQQRAKITLKDKNILLQTPADYDRLQRQAMMNRWYREQLKQAIPFLIAKWQPIMEVKVNKFFVRRMKTKWGSCNVTQGNIRLNTELAKKPKFCLEYVVVHEMNHLLVPNHGQKFIFLMDCFLPQWREYQQILNSLPISYSNS